jgi:hypothetical protein
MDQMTKSASREAPVVNRKTPDGHAVSRREVADLVRHCSSSEVRQGFRVSARGVSGHIFFERGRVIHAEFGEDCGLRAVVEMLRAGPVQLELASTWPSQPSLHLGPELLLSMTARDASRVVRKVDLPVEPPPLPEPEANGAPELIAPVHPGAPRVTGKRAISGIMPRVVESDAEAPVEPAWAPRRASQASNEVDASARVDAPVRGEASAVASRFSAAVAVSRLAASVAVSERAKAKAAGQRAPTGVDPHAAAALGQRMPSELPLTRAQKARSRSITVARASRSVVPNAAPPEVPVPESQRRSAKPPASSRPTVAPPGTAQPTTMVRIAARGELLAARGKNSEQLAQAAAFIHGLANLIAADFGRRGRANVHLSGGGMSLLVARSEVNDIAAALGPTERLTSLLAKVGLK